MPHHDIARNAYLQDANELPSAPSSGRVVLTEIEIGIGIGIEIEIEIKIECVVLTEMQSRREMCVGKRLQRGLKHLGRHLCGTVSLATLVNDVI